jgi:hypothetical protein
MGQSSFTTLASALKERYAKTIVDVTYKVDPWYARIRKVTDWGGKTKKFPVQYGHNQSASATFSEAQANVDGLKISAWDMVAENNKKMYLTAKFPGDLIRAMNGGQEKAYFPVITAECDSAFATAARRYSLQGFRSGWGDIGRMSNAAAADPTLTLTQPGEAMNFEIGMKLEFAADNDSGAKRAGVAYVASVDEDANTIELSSDQAGTTPVNTNAVSGLAQNDYIFPSGDRHATAASRLVIAGKEAWIPYDRTVITSTTYFGVNRLLHPTRLAGRYVDGTSLKLMEALQKGMTYAAIQGNPDTIWLDWSKWLQLEYELGSKVQYEDVEVATVGFRSIVLSGPKGKVNVFQTTACPSNRFFVDTMDTWSLLSMGDPIGFLDDDDLMIQRVSNADAYEARIGGYAELFCSNPVANCIGNW